MCEHLEPFHYYQNQIFTKFKYLCGLNSTLDKKEEKLGKLNFCSELWQPPTSLHLNDICLSFLGFIKNLFKITYQMLQFSRQ